jgi:hypothetical protein
MMPLNIQSFARLAQLGNSPQLQAPTLSTQVVPFRGFNPPPDTGMDVDEVYRSYNPRTTMQDLAQQLIGDFPQRDPHPSVWRRIGAVLAGMGSENPMATSDQFMNYHYYNKLRDFKNQFDPVSKAADDERLANAQLRQLAEQTVSRKLTERKQTEQERRNQELETQGQKKIDIQQQRANVYQFKAMNPQLKLVNSAKGGNLYSYNPLTGELKDTGVDSGTLSDIDKINLQLESSLEQIRERGAQTRTTQSQGIAQRNEATKEQIGLRGEETRKTKTTPSPNKPGTNVSSELEKQRGMVNRAREAALKPEWAKYIQINGNNITVTQPGRFSGPSASTYQAITDYITGKSSSPSGAAGSVKSNVPSRGNTGGRVRVQNPDGRMGTIDASELNQALAAGWKKIGG